MPSRACSCHCNDVRHAVITICWLRAHVVVRVVGRAEFIHAYTYTHLVPTPLLLAIMIMHLCKQTRTYVAAVNASYVYVIVVLSLLRAHMLATSCLYMYVGVNMFYMLAQHAYVHVHVRMHTYMRGTPLELAIVHAHIYICMVDCTYACCLPCPEHSLFPSLLDCIDWS